MSTHVSRSGSGFFRELLLSTTCGTVLVLGVPAYAQTDDDSLALDQIVVTTQKREQNLQDVPISITALGRDELERGAITELDDYIETIPNVTFFKNSNFAPDVTIRGISANVGGQFDPIAVSIDGLSLVSTNTSTVLNARLFDLERVEVQRGPQGTLSGISALGGAINYVTAKPNTDGIGGSLQGELGRFDAGSVQGTINLPLSDTFAVRASAYVDTRGGAVVNRGPSGGESDFDMNGIRAAARWAPTDKFTLDAAFSVENQEFGLNDELSIDAYFSDEDRAEAIAELAALGGDYFATDFIENDGVGNNGGDVFLDADVRSNLDISTAQAKATYELEQHTVSAAYGRFEFEGLTVDDRDKTEFAISQRTTDRELTSDVLELLVQSDYGGSFEWVAGLSYRDETIEERSVSEDGDETLGGAYSLSFVDDFITNVESVGVFANLFWDPTDRLSLSLGGRLSEDEVSISSVGAETFAGITRFFETNSETRFTPRIAANYELNSNVNAYVQVATGYRLGNGQSRAISLGLVDADVESETAVNYEAGLKGQLFDGRVGFSASVFMIDYNDLQVTSYAYVADEGYVYFDTNASEAYVRGAEVEIRARPLDGLDLNASIAHLDTEIDEINYFGTIFDDVDIPQARPWSASAGVRYTRPINDTLDIYGSADVLWRDEAFEGFEPVLADAVNEYTVANFALGLETEGFVFEGFIDNAFDETYWLSNTTGGSLRGTAVNFIPRTYGLRLRYKFGTFR